MAHQEESQQRKISRMRMQEAQKLYEGRHPEQGVEAMKNVLEIDPGFIECHQWLADHYERIGQTRHAVTQYEEMLRLDPENPATWEGLRRVDPITAEKLERLRNAPPDPFVGGANVDVSDLDDFEEAEGEEELTAPAVGPAATPVTAPADDVFLDDDDDEDEAGVGYEAMPWAHEQDAEYRDQLEQNRGFCDVLDGFSLFWEDPQGWSHLIAETRAPMDAGWPRLDELAPAASADLHAKPPTIMVEPDHTRTPVALPMHNPTVVIGETLQHALNDQETLFALGVAIHQLLADTSRIIWAAQQVAERELDCELRQRVIRHASDFTMGWDQSMPREEVTRLKKLCHAWELRSVLSADRAGLIACGHGESACRAIAAMVSDKGEGSIISVQKYLDRFKDVPPAELAAIPVSHDPWTDQQYAAYRIMMLRWWAKTDEYKKIAHA
ncbi:MAG: hypothetical protein GX131_16640 [candidate division WS1 bacterium]|jgi:tetratricopeptide (TPR) repeat protein|nr:hypothetical protein [candidate division WS1 bacterium]